MMKRLFLLLTLTALGAAAAAAAPDPVLLQRTGVGVAFLVTLPNEGVDLRVSAPGGTVFQRSFRGLESPAFSLSDERGLYRGDGQYTWEIHLTPSLGPSARRQMQEARERGDEATLRDLERLYLPPYPLVYSGSFRVERGTVLYDPSAFEPDPVPATASSPSGPTGPGVPLTLDQGRAVSGGGPTPTDVIHADDVIITGSECVGFDCLTDGTENFGFDTIKMKENNLRVFFDDTSTTAGFAANDWRLTANESSSGGANYFGLEDATLARTLFRVDAGAPANSLYVSSTGRVGIKTSTPVLNLHLVHGDTPSVRLDQDGSSGWTPQVWDLAGNESNFFVRDTTGGSKLPFRIQPNTPTNTLTLKSDGRVGMGTWSPGADLEVERTGADVTLLLDRTDGAHWLLANTSNGLVLDPNGTAASDVFRLGVTGDLLLAGVLTQGSSREIKSSCAAFGPGLLDAVAGLPLQLWSYTADASGSLHAGPMAEDFFHLFGLGADERHLAPSDLAGVTLAAVQELIRAAEEKDARIADLERQNADLASRLARLEEAFRSAHAD